MREEQVHQHWEGVEGAEEAGGLARKQWIGAQVKLPYRNPKRVTLELSQRFTQRRGGPRRIEKVNLFGHFKVYLRG